MVGAALWGAPRPATSSPPILSSHHVIYHSTLHRPHVSKVCLLHRLHLIQNKVMAHQEIYDHMSIC